MGGLDVAQMRKREVKVVVPFRAAPSLVEQIDGVHAAEGGDENVTRSEVVEYLVTLGVALYAARASAGHEELDAFLEAAASVPEGYAELLRRGLERPDSRKDRKKER